ncbi:MAG: hypothetical protein N2319_12810 [Candidatus Kapabacteria bacterium]|nr:hypothetical protein [Candidatus Kapabacteria bacterium]
MKLQNKILLMFLLISVNNYLFSETPESIVEKNLRARGNIDSLQNLKTFRIIGKIETEGIEFPMVYYYKSPDKYRIQIDLMGQSGITVFNGDQGWIVDPSQNILSPQILSSAEINSIKPMLNCIFSFYSDMLIDYKSKGIVLDSLYQATFDGKKVFNLAFTTPKKHHFIYSIDPTTYIDLFHTVVLSNTNLTFHLKLSDFYALNGIVFPRIIESKVENNQRLTKVIIDNIQVNNPIDDSLFTIP